VSVVCGYVHDIVRSLPRHRFPFNESKIPDNGIYVLFQEGESGHRADRIVRVGTHTGSNQLRSRIKQHFLIENKDRSIFRKNVGRAILTKNSDPFIKYWEIDLTTRAARNKYASLIDYEYQKEIESLVSEYIQQHFSFVVFSIEEKTVRLDIESKLISTVSWCDECKPTDSWLGLHSPKLKIKKSGLWLVNQLNKTPFIEQEIKFLEQKIKG